MATAVDDDCCPCSNIVIMQLFHELKQQFPAVPDRVVSDCIRQNYHDRAACEVVLRRENHGYLMHSYPVALKMTTPAVAADVGDPCGERCAGARVHADYYAAIRETSAQVIQNMSNANNNNNNIDASEEKNYVNRSLVTGSVDSHSVNPSAVMTGTQWFARGSTTRLVGGGDDSNLRYPPYDQVPYAYQRVENQRTTNSSQFFTQQQQRLLDDNSNSPPSPAHVVASRVSVQSSTTFHKHCNRPCSLNVPPVENNLNHPLSEEGGVKPRARAALHVEPVPHYASRNYWGGGGGTLASSPTTQPRSYTSVNLTLRPPSLEPQPPIDIASAGTSLTYSTSSYDPRQGFQSHLQIRIGPGGVGSVSALRTRAPDGRPRSCYGVPAAETVTTPTEPSRLRADSLPDVATLSVCSEDDSYVRAVAACDDAGSLRDQLRAIGGDQLHTVTQALLAQQLERKNRLRRELKREKQKLRDMHRDVQEMAEDLARRQLHQRAANIALPVVTSVLQKVQSLRQEITFLQTECKQMTTEVDMSSDNLVPLGETDEAFYKNIYTGQRCVLNRHPTSNAHRQEERSDPRPPMSPLDVDGPNWTCTECTFRNHPLLDKCEQCEMPRIVLGETQDIHIRVTHHNFPARRGVIHSWVV